MSKNQAHSYRPPYAYYALCYDEIETMSFFTSNTAPLEMGINYMSLLYDVIIKDRSYLIV